MKHEVPLPRLQQPATCPYPEPARSSSCPQLTLWRSILILSFNLRLGLPICLFPARFPSTTPHTLSLSPYVLHAPPVSFFLIDWMAWGNLPVASSPLICPACEVLSATQLPWHVPQDHLTTQAQLLHIINNKETYSSRKFWRPGAGQPETRSWQVNIWNHSSDLPKT